MEEVIITSSLIDASSDAISNPLHVVSGESIAIDASQSIGASIDGLVGVSSSDYGAAVGQPIIRGMSGSRVKILNNGKVIRDVSGLGPDHVNDSDLHDIQQIEIVRGPSSLLYANGTIGGIVNIVDNTIARKDFEESKFKLGFEAQSVNDGDAHNFSFQNNIGGLNISAAYKDSQLGNFDIPHGAVIHHEEEHHDEDHEDEDHEGEEHEGEEHEGEEHEEDLGFLPNSDVGSTSKRLGISKAGDWGFFGLSVSDTENLYGIPYHGEGHEGHEDDHADGDHDDDHDDDHADEDSHDDHEGEGEHEGERIFSKSESSIVNLEGSVVLGNSLVTKIDYHFRDSDYSLTEQHAEEEGHEGEEHGDDHHEEGPTTFSNEAREYGAIFDLGNDSLSQKIAINYVIEDVAVIGDEAFINPTESKELTLGYYLSKELDLFHIDFGVRHDQVSRKGSVSHEDEHDDDHDEHEEDHDDDHADEHGDEHEAELEYFDRDVSTTSYAMTLSRDVTESLEVNLGLSSVERAPSTVELLMNGPHLATGRVEVGNFNLKSEQSNNIDLTFNYSNDGFFAAMTFFQNNVDNYIYLMDESEEEHEEHEEEEHHGGLILANYLQQDAEFDGYELEIGKTFDLARGALTLSYGRDSVSGEFTDGSNIPRMTPERDLYKIAYVEDGLKLLLSLKDVAAQNDTAENEMASAGYQMLNLNISKTIEVSSDNILTLSLFGKNLLDEAARNHTSFVKDEVPLAGRNLGVRASYSF
ncbi:MAG: TonB-dependent receptor [Porticoccaceae bacterium]|nr:TonB-dependent receptor [Porticoccaceae bacterium]